MPETIKQSQMMPATIKEESISYSKSKKKMAMSMPIENKKKMKNFSNKFGSYPQEYKHEE